MTDTPIKAQPAPVTSLPIFQDSLLTTVMPRPAVMLDQMLKAAQSSAVPVKPATADKPASDPVMQALLQQLEYTKPSATTIPASQASKVTVLPASGQTGPNPLLIVGVLALAGVLGFFLLKGGKKGSGHKGGATKLETDH